MHCFTFFPYKSIRDQIWPCRKIDQGQPRVIIWINSIIHEHPMLHTKFQDQQPFGSGEEDFYFFLAYMGMAAILIMWPGLFEQTFVPPSHRSSMWNLTLIGQAVSEEMFKECRRRRTTTYDDGRRRPTYHISSPVSLWLRWAKNCDCLNNFRTALVHKDISFNGSDDRRPISSHVFPRSGRVIPDLISVENTITFLLKWVCHNTDIPHVNESANFGTVCVT